MRDRFSSPGDARPSPGAAKRRLRADLESRGLSREISQPMATRLAPLLKSTSTRAYGAALDAAAAAVEVVRGGAGEPPERAASAPDRAGDVAEIQRLMLGFTDELRKLEEGLRILSAFVVRMRTRAGFDGDGVLH
jgi:hypothetical protein